MGEIEDAVTDDEHQGSEGLLGLCDDLLYGEDNTEFVVDGGRDA